MENSIGYNAHMITSTILEADLKAAASRSPQDLAVLERFFKTKKGQYAAGDMFIGVTVPINRQICKKYQDLSLAEIEKALESPVHEVRLAAVIIMASQAKKGSEAHKKALFDLYLRRTDRINNWDIVDSSCRNVVGDYLLHKPRNILYKLARSDNLWEKRIAIVSTFAFISNGEYEDTYKIAEILLNDKHDLIHKAVGWMLRETEKKLGADVLRTFLNKHASLMPRTALRYAIEHFAPEERAKYLAKKG